LNDSETPDSVAAFLRLAVKDGLSLGLLAGRRRDSEVLLAAATLVFVDGRDYDEPAVNAGLKGWLAGPGRMLATDHVELRRWLVDDGWLERDGYGRRYRRTAPTRERSAFLAALAAVDLATIAAAARAEDALRRAKRKAEWKGTAGHGPAT
jgi:hypothetical protein